jgi:hypothetical protein
MRREQMDNDTLKKAVLGGRDPGDVIHECNACHRLFGKDDLGEIDGNFISHGVAPSGRCPVCEDGWAYPATILGLLAVEKEDVLNILEFVGQARAKGHEQGILEEMDLADEAWLKTLDRFGKVVG